MSIVLVSSDMQVASRLRGTAERLGKKLSIALSPADLPDRLANQPQLVIFDLTQPELDIAAAVESVRRGACAARTLAFGPHVDENSLASANLAGCDRVVSNGTFHREQAALITQLCPPS